MVNPILIIKGTPAGWSPIWNYAYISVFQRYYFINNWTWLNGCWECDAVCDVLASFKTDIGNLSEYVLRSSNRYNEQVVDMQYPTTAETRVDARMLNTQYPFVSVFSGGYYVVGIISNDQSAAQGAITYYQMTPAELAALKHYMMSDTFMTEQGLDVQTVIDYLPNELLKTLYDPFKYIASCVWMPFPAADYMSSLKTSVTSIPFGWFEPTTTQLNGYRLNQNGYVKKYTDRISVSGHPQRPGRGVFLDHPPFCDRMLFYPPYGSIPINDDSIIGGDALRIEIDVDMILGDSTLSVFHDRPLGNDNYRNMGVIARVSAPLAVPIQLAQTTIDIGGSVTAAETLALHGTASALIGQASTGTDLFTGLFETAKAAVNSTISAIGDVIQNPVGQLQTSGTNGSLAQYSIQPYFIEKYRIVADDDNAQKGRPLCQVQQISSIPGYIMVDSPDVQLPCMETERQQIVSFMASGFFYE